MILSVHGWQPSRGVVSFLGRTAPRHGAARMLAHRAVLENPAKMAIRISVDSPIDLRRNSTLSVPHGAVSSWGCETSARAATLTVSGFHYTDSHR
jgi:hypothetical protein